MKRKTYHTNNMTLEYSVIIPAHNAEKTLRRAVESVCRALDPAVEAGEEMPAPVYEVLIVENGSEDGTEFLGRTLELEHPDTVRFLRSEKGVSNARNKGLDEAAGSWILFLDADDYLLEDAGKILRENLHFTGTDLIVHSFESGSNVVHVCAAGGERFAGVKGGGLEEIIVRMIEDPTRYTSVWSKFFKRERIEYEHLRFSPELRLSEDSYFLIRYLTVCRRIRLLDRPFYHYSTDNDSVVRTWDGKKEEGFRRSLEAVRQFLRTQPEVIRRAFAGYGMMQFNILMVREVFAAGHLSAVQKIREMVRISREEPFASAIQQYDPKRHKGMRYLPLRLLKGGFSAGAAAVYEARVLQNTGREKIQ